MKTIKKCIFLFNIVVILLFLCSCHMSTKAANKYLDMILADEFASVKEKFEIQDKCKDDEIFLEVILNRLDKNNIQQTFKLIRALDKFGYDNEVLKSNIQEYIQEIRNDILNQNSSISFTEYIKLVQDYLNENRFVEVTMCCPYDMMKTYIEKNYTSTILKNEKEGYYYDHRSEYKNEKSNWYSPLTREYSYSGYAGTYQTTNTFKFYGDFLTQKQEQYWYMSSVNDSNNENIYSVFFEGRCIFKKSHKGISSSDEMTFNKVFSGGNIYYGHDEKVQFIFFLISDNAISILDNSISIFTINYEK